MRVLDLIRRVISLLLMGLTLVSSISFASENTVAKPDVRVLIDISGSMKKNDPKNLRIPALQLITNLLPKNSDAGVWAFGRYVNMMVPLKPVDNEWQKKATEAAKKINSLGLYTNIGGALEKASYGWSRADSNEKRSMILLTDGMVDISKDADVNAKERKRILEQLLPRLKAAGVAIHTIALSPQADHQLLKTLSAQTDGWYAAVDSADELEKIFLKIFEQAAARDNLPISDNRFTVDASIEEMTVLVFKKKNAKPVELIAPSLTILSAKKRDTNLRWFTSGSYDLITVTRPEVGEWQIDADIDPDNRVMVVSKLGLKVAPIPNNILAGETINYQLQLLEEGKVITKPEFLRLVDAKLTTQIGESKSTLAMFFDAAEASFKQSFFADVEEGELKLSLRVKSPTFERQRQHAINVYGSPAVIKFKISESTAEPHELEFNVRSDIVQADTLQGNLVVHYPDGEKQFLTLTNFFEPVQLRVLAEGGEYQIEQEYSGKSASGRAFKVSPKVLTFVAPVTREYQDQQNQQTVQVEPQAETSTASEPEPEPELVPESEPVAAAEPEPSPQAEQAPPQETKDEGLSTMTWVYIGIGFNLLVAGLGFLFWRWWKQKGMNDSEALANEIELDEEVDTDQANADHQAADKPVDAAAEEDKSE